MFTARYSLRDDKLCQNDIPAWVWDIQKKLSDEVDGCYFDVEFVVHRFIKTPVTFRTDNLADLSACAWTAIDEVTPKFYPVATQKDEGETVVGDLILHAKKIEFEHVKKALEGLLNNGALGEAENKIIGQFIEYLNPS